MQLRKRALPVPPPSNKRRTAATIAPVDTAPAVEPAVPAPPPPSTTAVAKTIAPAQVLFVKRLDGITVTLRFEGSETVFNFKKRLSPLSNFVAPESMRLIFAGRQLEDDKVLSDYNIKIESTLHLVLRLCGD